MRRLILSFALLLLLKSELQADCAHPVGMYASCSSSATTPSNASSDAFDSKFTTSLLVIGIGVGVGLGIIYLVSQAFKSESSYTFKPLKAQPFFSEGLKSYASPVSFRPSEPNAGQMEWRWTVSTLRW